MTRPSRATTLRPLMPARPESTYPERRFGGFTRVDGTVPFFARVHALALEARTVVDVGCGRGEQLDDPSAYRRQLRDLRASGRRVIGIDVDDAAAENPFIDEFRRIGPEFKWPIEDGTADLVLADRVLEHVPDPEAFVAELDRVLAPGGIFAARTPNRLSYPALAARLVPNRMHARVVGYVQVDRKAEDVFPTFYRMNSRRRLTRLLGRRGLATAVITIESEPNYFRFSHPLYAVMARVHPLIPPPFRSTLLVFSSRPRR